MNRICKRFFSLVLISTLLIQTIANITCFASVTQTTEITNGYITATISNKNGGFTVRTEKGNTLRKDDNNKELLYHSGDYDTSFTTLRVKRNGKTNDYLFGGEYGFLGLSSSPVSVTGDNTSVNTTWSVDGIMFTQRIELANQSSPEHGMVNISYDAEITDGGNPADIQVRILLDTAIDTLDYAYYNIQSASDDGGIRTIKTEKIINASDYGKTNAIPATFYACDDPEFPSVYAYTVNNAQSQPYQVAFAH